MVLGVFPSVHDERKQSTTTTTTTVKTFLYSIKVKENRRITTTAKQPTRPKDPLKIFLTHTRAQMYIFIYVCIFANTNTNKSKREMRKSSLIKECYKYKRY